MMMMTTLPALLLTRPVGASERFRATLREAGFTGEIVVSPALKIVPRSVSLPKDFAGAVFTSKNGVKAVPARDLPCWCVGDSTAEAAKERGWKAISAGGDVEALYRRIMADAPEGVVLHIRGEHARGDLVARLRAGGLLAKDVVAYDQRAEMLTQDAKRLLLRENPVVLPLFSPRSAAQIVSQGPFAAPLYVVAMSKSVAGAASGLLPKEVAISEKPDARSMVAAINHFADAARVIESGPDYA